MSLGSVRATSYNKVTRRCGVASGTRRTGGGSETIMAGGQHVDVLSSTSASWPTKQTATLATRKKQETELLQNAAKFSYLEGKVEKQLDCIIIGAGISGLDAAYHIKVGFM